MKPCKEYLDTLIDGSFFKLPENQQKKIEQKIAQDPECFGEFKKMKKTIELVKNNTIAEPDQSYWDSYWDRLDQRMSNEQTKESKNYWPALFKAAAFIIGGIFIGYLLFNNSDSEKLVKSSQKTNARQVALNNETAELLEDSKILLLGIVNLDADDKTATKIDFSFQKKVSANLLRKTADLKQMLQDSPNRRVISLLSDLEIILMQISNLDNEFDLPAIEIIRNGATDQSILFKINMEIMLLDARREAAENNNSTKKQNVKS